MRWHLLPSVLLLTLCVTACKPEDFKPYQVVVCPKLREYDPAFLQQALKEYERLPEGSTIKIMFGDYKALRDQVRVCLQ